MLKILSIIVNIFIPGIGTMMMGRIGTGLVQLILVGLSAVLNFLVITLIIGVPLYAIVWLWAVVGVALMPDPDRKRIGSGSANRSGLANRSELARDADQLEMRTA